MAALPNEDLVELLRAVTVEVRGPKGHGSGIAWPGATAVVTCNHVMQADHAIVVFAGGQERKGRVLLRRPESDLAVLALDATSEAPAIALRETPLRVGEVLFAMGHPWGEPRALTSGVLLSEPGDGPVTVDLRVAPGNSGGPLVDAEGRLVGIITMYRGGAAVAIPVTEALSLLGTQERADAA